MSASQIVDQKAADLLLARTFLDIKPASFLCAPCTREFDSTEMRSIEQQFANNLREAGLPGSIFAEDEIQDLIRALRWCWTSELEFSFGLSGIPLFPRHKKELITGPDKFKARTRMALCSLEARGKPVHLEDYVGYLCDEWWEYVDEGSGVGSLDGEKFGEALLSAISRRGFLPRNP